MSPRRRAGVCASLGALVLLLVAAGAHAALRLNPAQPIVGLVTVQPIVVSNDDGSGTATFFGNPGQQVLIEGFVDDVWAQAGIDIDFLAPTFWNDTFANVGAPGAMDPRPTDDLFDIVEAGDLAGVGHPDPTVLDVYFVSIAAGFGMLGPNSAAGLGIIDGNGITQYVGASLVSFLAGQELVASVVAHEIGHNLGLDHILRPGNLMQAAGSPDPGQQLDADQMATVLASPLVAAVAPPPAPRQLPLPLPAVLALAVALAVSGARRGRGMPPRVH